MSHDEGMRVRREVLGDEHVDRAVANTTELTRDFQGLITRYAWGEIWTRPGLERRTRSCITLTALVARGQFDELALHIRAPRRCPRRLVARWAAAPPRPPPQRLDRRGDRRGAAAVRGLLRCARGKQRLQ